MTYTVSSGTLNFTRLNLADRTNGRAYATVLRPSVCRLSVTCRLLLLNGASSYLKLSEEASRKWPMGSRMVTWAMASCDPERSKSWPQYY